MGLRTFSWPGAVRSALSVIALVAVPHASHASHASDASSGSVASNDGVYGRLDGDVDLRLGTGASYWNEQAALTAHVSAVYLQSAGLYTSYLDTANGQARALGVGLHFQPLFLARMAYDLEKGPSTLDLWLDSIALEMGPSFHGNPRAAFTTPPTLEVAGIMELPLFGRATGLFLGARAAYFVNFSDVPQPERSASFGLMISWHQLLATHLVDARDRRMR